MDAAADGPILRHAGCDNLVAAALYALAGKPPPVDIDVHRALCVALGRSANGHRRLGFGSNDGLGTGMETLVYMFNVGTHTHHGADDCMTQLKV